MMDQKPHPIALEQLMFTRSSVIAVPGYQPVENQATAAPVNEISVTKIPNEPGRYTASMKTQVNQSMDKSSPYCVDMECIVVLVADDTLSEEEVVRGITITAHSVLFGAIREAVAWITGRQVYGQLMLGLSVLRSAPKVKAES